MVTVLDQFPVLSKAKETALKIADIETIELQNIPVTPPLFKQPVRATARLLKVRTDDGIVGLSQYGGFMHSASAAFIHHELAPLLRGQDPLENERLMHQMLWKFNSVFNPELQLADHREPVRYQMSTPPPHRDVVDPHMLYIHPSRGRRSRAIDAETEEFVEQTRINGNPSA